MHSLCLYYNALRHLQFSLGGPFLAGEEARGSCKFNSESRKCPTPGKVQQNTVSEYTCWTCEFGPEDKQPAKTDLLPEVGARVRAPSKKVRGMLQAAQGLVPRGFATYPIPGGLPRGFRGQQFTASVCVQCGCCCGWTVKRFAHPDLQQYCRVSATQEEHADHGSTAKLPQHARRGALSSDARDWIEELVLAGFPQAEVIRRVRAKVQEAFADDPYVDGGLKVCMLRINSRNAAYLSRVPYTWRGTKICHGNLKHVNRFCFTLGSEYGVCTGAGVS